ncbi:MAG: cytochrome C [Geobacter sp.]|nr:cytochrome C [Geobacter sp.]
MMKHSIACLCALLALVALTACSQNISPRPALPAVGHPEPLPQGRPICSDCHEVPMKDSLKSYAVLDHTATFVKDHRFAAASEAGTCAVCHKESFCNECHANYVEVKPSTLHGDRPDRDLPHRGDYLSRHKVDGRLDPASCYRCHGRTNNEKCVTCHRH